MSVKSFFKLVEIQTKVASMVPFLLGTIYALYHFHAFRLENFLLMFGSLLFIDMATTTINNLLDYKRANKKEGYGFETHNAIVKYNMKEGTVMAVIVVLVTIAAVLGFFLYLNTNFLVLLLGALSFLVGVVYSFGPIPISRTPFGEIFSGGFMGLVIPFLAVYIHIFNQDLINLSYITADGQMVLLGIGSQFTAAFVYGSAGLFTISLQLRELLFIFLLSVPAAVGIANIMLANNICDMEEDLENKRYTLPIFIGKRNALFVFAGLYFIGYAAIVLLVFLHVTPLISLITLATLPIVVKHLSIFYKKQSKQDTFALSVKNLLLMNVIFILSLVIAYFFKV